MAFAKCRKHTWNADKTKCLVCGITRVPMDEPTRKVISNTVVDHEKRIRALEIKLGIK